MSDISLSASEIGIIVALLSAVCGPLGIMFRMYISEKNAHIAILEASILREQEIAEKRVLRERDITDRMVPILEENIKTVKMALDIYHLNHPSRMQPESAH